MPSAIFGLRPMASIVTSAPLRARRASRAGLAQYAKVDRFHGLPVVPWENLEEFFPPDQVWLLGPLSYRRVNEFRRARYLEGKRRNYRFASFIHPNCHVYTKEIGENCFILEANVIQPFVKIGNNVMLWSNNHIGHHSI